MRFLLAGVVAVTLTGGATSSPGGALFLIGGGTMGDEVLGRLAVLVGGRHAPVVLVPTAFCWSEDLGEDSPQVAQYLGRLRSFGFDNVEILHTRSPAEANEEHFGQPLRDARVVFFSGGCPECITSAYLNTRFHRELERLLARGGVVAGTSAGAEVMGPFIEERCENPVVKGPGLGLFARGYFGVHIDTRPDLLESMKSAVDSDYPSLLGIGIAEDTAVLIKDDALEVVGRGSAVVYRGRGSRVDDDTRETRLSAGETYRLPE